MLARELVPALQRAGWSVHTATRAQCDVTIPAQVGAAVGKATPQVVFNLAAYTAVDRAESDPAAAFLVNAKGAAHVAEACAVLGATVVQLSTDYAFDGKLRRPYTEDDPPSPLGVYARSKVEGEKAVIASGAKWFVVRTGELYGFGGHSFFSAIFARARAGQPLRVVSDQWVTPTWTRDLATQLVAIAERAPHGLYHATCAGEVTWDEAARTALELAGVGAELTSVTTAEYGSRTPRPPYSVLSHAKLARLGLYRMRPWREALAAWLAETPP